MAQKVHPSAGRRRGSAASLRPRRCHRRGRLRRVRPRRARQPRPGRHPGQRRGRIRGRRSRLHLARRVGPDADPQPPFRRDRLPRGAPRHDGGRLRSHRQYLVSGRGPTGGRLHRLYRRQGRHHHPHPGPGQRGSARHHGERRAAQHHGYAGQSPGAGGRRPLQVGQHRRGGRGHRVSGLGRRGDGVGRDDPGLSGTIPLTLPCAPSKPCATSARCCQPAYSRMPPMTAWPHTLLGVAAVLFLLAGCAGPPSGARPVAVPAASDGELHPPVRETLPNGLRLIVQEHRAADIVALYLWVGVGVRYEKPDELGYSHFMEHMLFKGTDKWGPGYLDRAVEGVGGRSNAVTSFDYTTFYLILPTDAMEMGVQLLADMGFRSVFAPEEIAREREVIFEEAHIEADNPKTAIIRQLYGLVFDANPYGRPVLGTPATMNAATHDRLLAYYKHYYTPENMALVVAGPVEFKTVRAAVNRTFGRMPATGLKPMQAPAPAPLGSPNGLE